MAIKTMTPAYRVGEVIAHFNLDELDALPSEIVLRYVGGYQPYATHFHNMRDGGYYWGHYFADLQQARADFIERCTKHM